MLQAGLVLAGSLVNLLRAPPGLPAGSLECELAPLSPAPRSKRAEAGELLPERQVSREGAEQGRNRSRGGAPAGRLPLCLCLRSASVLHCPNGVCHRALHSTCVQVWSYFIQIALALQYLHHNHVSMLLTFEALGFLCRKVYEKHLSQQEISRGLWGDCGYHPA